MTTFSVRVRNDETRNRMTDYLELLKGENPKINNYGEALEEVFRGHSEGFAKLRLERISISDQSVLERVNCPYLKIEGIEFRCFEDYHKKKKSVLIESIDEGHKVISFCEMCMTGKANSIQQEIEKQLRRKNIKTLTALHKALREFAGSQAFAKFFMCIHDANKGTLKISRNGIHFWCPYAENEQVTIQNFCMNRPNSTKGIPPCEHLYHEDLPVEVKPPEEITDLIEQLEFSDNEQEEEGDNEN